jgi:hypothetical protein
MFCTPGGGLIGGACLRVYRRSFCPAGDWKMATIAEFSFSRHLDGCAFAVLLLSGEMCRFLQRRRAGKRFGIEWRFVVY